MFSESRNIKIIEENFTNKICFLSDCGLPNLRARGRLTKFRFGMALIIAFDTSYLFTHSQKNLVFVIRICDLFDISIVIGIGILQLAKIFLLSFVNYDFVVLVFAVNRYVFFIAY